MKRLIISLLLIGVLFSNLLAVVPAYADEPAENCSKIDAVLRGTQFYNCATSDTCNAGNIITDLTGETNEERAWNFFRGKGLDDMHTAAVVGNFMQESGLNPIRMEIGGTSQNPADADPKGWGVAQWTPGSKIVGIAQNLGITGPIFELGTQLNIVWAEMTGIAPTGYKNVVEPFNAKTTIEEAVSFFQKNYEGGANYEPRLRFAKEAFDKYKGQSTGNTTGAGAATGCGPSAALSPDCLNATGPAKILCAAKVYDPVSYELSGRAGHQGGAAWHKTCPTINASCVLDCSGLVNIAVYDVYGVDLRQNTFAEVSDTTNWKRISIAELGPGDIVQPNPDHVEIVDHVQGDIIYTFGAHTSHAAQEKQVGPSSTTVRSGTVFLRYIGQGAEN